MPRRETHQIIGRIFGAGLVFIFFIPGILDFPLIDSFFSALPKDISDVEIIALMFIAFGSVLAGTWLPDFVEPATSSWHRGVFHSWVTLLGTLYIGIQVALGNIEAPMWFDWSQHLWKTILVFSIFGYDLHLLLDFVFSKRRLPLLWR